MARHASFSDRLSPQEHAYSRSHRGGERNYEVTVTAAQIAFAYVIADFAKFVTCPLARTVRVCRRTREPLHWTEFVFRVTRPTLPGTCARLRRLIHNINPTLLTMNYLSIEANESGKPGLASRDPRGRPERPPTPPDGHGLLRDESPGREKG